MRRDNETCIQRTRLFFNFFEKSKEKAPFEGIIKVKKVTPEAVRNLNKFLSSRLERIAAMMELLAEIHTDWAITGKKDYILMETETLDFNDIVRTLREHGFDDNEFILKVEYTRKWGIL
ncbi:hypothetical protein REC12_01350 [Desulfosporosinus sp. PR]|uniref:hypothetical protein n=1 Tax=Candidatus Desulfosporosinus nitrosoreducens TaxID=3401928 RepID=UPI0027FDAEEE|nr:hypothetical protein [Desulfosporosinus sp. PR]MDQ7092236.1 hypothetical protein [Desulfosporosinus sp. PR]